jgi:hypothetical protein
MPKIQVHNAMQFAVHPKSRSIVLVPPSGEPTAITPELAREMAKTLIDLAVLAEAPTPVATPPAPAVDTLDVTHPGLPGMVAFPLWDRNRLN